MKPFRTKYGTPFELFDWAFYLLIIFTVVFATGALYFGLKSDNDCSDHGGQEVFQYFIPAGKGILVPVYKCEGETK